LDPITISLALLIALVVVALPLLVIWRKGRPAAPGEVFRASRLTAGNRVFPTQVIVTPQSVVHFTPQWIGRLDHSIHIAHVASVSINTGLMFSDVLIETTGGSGPIRCRGHRKGDAIRIKQLIEEFQSAYYRGAAANPGPAAVPAPLPAR
jgi:hypothetical protein